jgi:hypothetical protein
MASHYCAIIQNYFFNNLNKLKSIKNNEHLYNYVYEINSLKFELFVDHHTQVVSYQRHNKK